MALKHDADQQECDAQSGESPAIATAIMERIDWSKADHGSICDSICQALRHCCSDAGEAEEIWLGRMESLAQLVCAMVSELRDAGYAKLDLPTFFKALELDSIKRMREIEWIDDSWRLQACGYMKSLPGFDQALPASEQDGLATEAHDYLRFAVELPLRRALGLGFGDHPPIIWERIPTTRLEKLAIEEKVELQACLEKRPKKIRRRL